MTATAKNKAESERYVITHTGVDDWQQGQVVAREDFQIRSGGEENKVLHDRFDRLVSLGAIRPATEAEAGLTRVSAGTANRVMSSDVQMRLAQQEADIARLTGILSDLQDREASHARLAGEPATTPGTVAADDPAVSVLLDQKDAQIGALKTAVEQLAQKVQEREKAAHERHAEAAKAQAAKDKEAGSPAATGQSAPVQDVAHVQQTGEQQQAEQSEHGKARRRPWAERSEGSDK